MKKLKKDISEALTQIENLIKNILEIKILIKKIYI